MWCVYIFCDQKTYKKSFYAKQFFDIQLVYSEKQPSKRDAEKRELQIKKWSVAKKKALIDNDLELLRHLSKGSGIADGLL